MLLESSSGQSFSLIVDRYEFPDEELGPTEDNPADEFDPGRFLVITVSVKTPAGSWQATAPEMTTTELERLAAWLSSVSDGLPSGRGAYFTERDLEFSVDEAITSISIHLVRDFLPPWEQRSSCTITFPLDCIDLSQAVSEIRSQIRQFPHRPRPDRSA